MKKEITTKVNVATVKAAIIKVKDGNVETELLPVLEIIGSGTLTEKKAIKELTEQYGENKYIIIESSSEKRTYSIPFETFMENAEQVEN